MSPPMRAAIRWTIGIALLVLVASWIDLEAVRRRLAGADAGLAVLAIGGLVAVHLVGALSWRRLTEALADIRLEGRTTVTLYYAGQAIGTVTPGNLGSDLYRIAAGPSGGAPERLIGPIVVQRLTSIIAMLLIAGLGALALPLDGLGPVGLALLGGATGSGLILLAVAADPDRLPARVGRFVDRWGRPSERARRRRVGAVLRDGVGLGLVFHGASIALGLALVAAVDPLAGTRPFAVLAALAVARTGLVVPLSPSGIGIQEGALTILFVGLGLSPDAALAASLLNRAAMLLTAVLGSVILVTGPRTTALVRVRSG